MLVAQRTLEGAKKQQGISGGDVYTGGCGISMALIELGRCLPSVSGAGGTPKTGILPLTREELMQRALETCVAVSSATEGEVGRMGQGVCAGARRKGVCPDMHTHLNDAG